MTELIPAKEIERIVGVKRQPYHVLHADSKSEVAYILHSTDCVEDGLDLRFCKFSTALDDNGLDVDRWKHYMDAPVRVTLNIDQDLIPVGGKLVRTVER